MMGRLSGILFGSVLCNILVNDVLGTGGMSERVGQGDSSAWRDHLQKAVPSQPVSLSKNAPSAHTMTPSHSSTHVSTAASPQLTAGRARVAVDPSGALHQGIGLPRPPASKTSSQGHPSAVRKLSTSTIMVKSSSNSMIPAPLGDPVLARTGAPNINPSKTMSTAAPSVATVNPTTAPTTVSTLMTTQTTTRPLHMAPTTQPTHSPTQPDYCRAIEQCRADATCNRCLTALAPTFPSMGTWVQSRVWERSFFDTLTITPECTATGLLNATMYTMMLASPHSLDLCDHHIITQCQLAEYNCVASNSTCQGCLRGIYSNPDSAGAISSPLCEQTSTELSFPIALACTAFPQCTFAKSTCSSTCAKCLDTLRGGDGAAAAQQCTPAGVTGIDFIVQHCAGNSKVSCDFWRERCAQTPGCEPCLQAMGYGTASNDVVARGRLAPVCRAALGYDLHVLFNYNQTASAQTIGFYGGRCPVSVLSTCKQAVLACVIYTEECARCILDDHPANASGCATLLASLGVTQGCTPCPDSVRIFNIIIIMTSVVGGVSVLGCLAVIVAIVAYGNDRVSLRHRIVIGLMVANGVYSAANVIPMSLLQSGVTDCGALALPFSVIRNARALWFGGKFALLSYEIFLLVASIWTLYRGVSKIPVAAEVVAHVLCVGAGVATFTVFYILASKVIADGANAAGQSEIETNEYSHLSPGTV